MWKVFESSEIQTNYNNESNHNKIIPEISETNDNMPEMTSKKKKNKSTEILNKTIPILSYILCMTAFDHNLKLSLSLK